MLQFEKGLPSIIEVRGRWIFKIAIFEKNYINLKDIKAYFSKMSIITYFFFQPNYQGASTEHHVTI